MYYIHITSATTQHITGHAKTLRGVKRNVAKAVLDFKECHGDQIKSVWIYKATKNAPKPIECVRQKNA